MQKSMRALGTWETGLVEMHDKLHAAGSGLNVIGFQGGLDAAKLKQVFRLLYDTHPLLRATIEKVSDQYFFVENALFENIHISFVEKKRPEEWQAIVENLIDMPFDKSESLWRIVVCYDHEAAQHELIFNIHHAIVDGVSLMALLEQIFSFYVELVKGNNLIVSSHQLQQNVENLSATLPSSGDKIDSDRPDAVEGVANFCYQKASAVGSRQTKCIYKDIGREKIYALRELCRKNKTTLGGLLNAVMQVSARHFYPDSPVVPMITPVNLREYFSPKLARDNLGFHVTCIATKHPAAELEGKNLWQIAQSYKEAEKPALSQALAKMRELSKSESSGLTNMFDFSHLKAATGFNSGFCVANKGMFVFPDHDEAIKMRFYYVTTSRQAGDIVMNLGVTSLQKKSCLTFTYCHPLVSDQLAQDFVKFYMSQLMCVFDQVGSLV